jgi:hypothetical protein
VPRPARGWRGVLVKVSAGIERVALDAFAVIADAKHDLTVAHDDVDLHRLRVSVAADVLEQLQQHRPDVVHEGRAHAVERAVDPRDGNDPHAVGPLPAETHQRLDRVNLGAAKLAERDAGVHVRRRTCGIELLSKAQHHLAPTVVIEPPPERLAQQDDSREVSCDCVVQVAREPDTLEDDRPVRTDLGELACRGSLRPEGDSERVAGPGHRRDACSPHQDHRPSHTR